MAALVRLSAPSGALCRKKRLTEAERKLCIFNGNLSEFFSEAAEALLSFASADVLNSDCALLLFVCWDCSQERVWAISIARLCALPRLHLRPINVIVFDGPCVEILS